MKTRWHILFALAVAGLVTFSGRSQDAETYEQPPINYSHSQPHDVIAQLRTDLNSGKTKLTGSDREIVQSLLRLLHIPVNSQLLVFSKTSFQKDRITPEHPRALYYSDNCYLGWVPGGLVELAAIDPKLGPIFYTFDPRAPMEQGGYGFRRDDECLRCHGGQFVPGIPAVFARSLYATKSGEPLYQFGTEVVDYHTPFAERWGGWYVTGTHGNTVHRGNVFADEDGNKLVFNPKAGANVTNLSKFFDIGDYLTNSSDIVALLVFEHQTAMQNALTRASVNCQHMLDYQKHLDEAFNQPAKNDELHFDSVRLVFDHAADDVVDTMLFKDEADMPDVITGSAEFQKTFCANVPRAHDGSSLKDLQLSDHLFKNRCSYLIYSDAFLSLPHPLKRRIYARLAKALNPKHPDPRYTYIHDSERKRIANILRETHPEFRKETGR